jgi:hypothetical protein
MLTLNLLTLPSELRCYSPLLIFSREITECIGLSLGAVIACRQRDMNALAVPGTKCRIGFECLGVYILHSFLAECV